MPIGDDATNVFIGLPGDGPRLELTHNLDGADLWLSLVWVVAIGAAVAVVLGREVRPR